MWILPVNAADATAASDTISDTESLQQDEDIIDLQLYLSQPFSVVFEAYPDFQTTYVPPYRGDPGIISHKDNMETIDFLGEWTSYPSEDGGACLIQKVWLFEAVEGCQIAGIAPGMNADEAVRFLESEGWTKTADPGWEVELKTEDGHYIVINIDTDTGLIKSVFMRLPEEE